MLAVGAEDYLTKPIKAELFLVRIKHYLQIIALRKKALDTKALAQNPFSQKIYSRSIIFKIVSEASLSEFWDYWLNNEKDTLDLSDCVRILYGFGLWLLKNNYTCTIEAEESDEHLYVMLKYEGSIKSSIIRNILTKHYPSAKYILSSTMLAFDLNKIVPQELLEIDDTTKAILTKTHDTVLSARDYIEETALSFVSKVENLDEINDEADRAIIAFETMPNPETLQRVCVSFQAYADTLEELVDFAHLGFALQTLIRFLSALNEEHFEAEKIKKLCSLLLNLLHDLSSWRDNVFISQVARDIHYLDASLLSSCLQIETIFEEKKLSTDDDIEFF